MQSLSVRSSLLAALSMAATASARAQISVGTNVHVSKLRDTLVHDEILIGADPSNRSNMVACSIAHAPGRRSLLTLAYTTTDAGVTWRPTVTDSGPMSGDPVCLYGPNGRAYFIAVSYGGSDILTVHRSTDGGSTWMGPTKIPRVPDRPQMAIDRTGGKYTGRVYIAYNASNELKGTEAGHQRTALGLVSSADGGETFTYPVMRMLPDSSRWGWPLDAEVLSDGTLVIFYKEVSTSNTDQTVLKAITSNDGGETLAPGVRITDMQVFRGDNNVCSAAVDASNGPFRDRLYAVWHDWRSGRAQIYLVYSADKGKTWSKPRLINDDREWPVKPDGSRGPNHNMANVAVNKDGVVMVMWYDRRDHPDEQGYWPRVSASLDGGDTWLPSVRVSERPKAAGHDEPWAFDVSTIRPDTNSPAPISVAVRRSEWTTGGHTAGIGTRADGVFFPLWVDDRTGRHQVWTAPVTVAGTVAKHGSADLASYTDVSGKVSVELQYASFDRAKGILSVTAQLKNVAKDTLRGPVRVRVLSVTSPVGVIAIENADNKAAGQGAVWDFSSLLPAAGLLPDSLSATRPLVFRLTDVRRAHPAKDVTIFGVLDMDVRVLVKK